MHRWHHPDCHGHVFSVIDDNLDIFFLIIRPPPTSTLFPYTTLFRSARARTLPRPTSRCPTPIVPTARRTVWARCCCPRSEEHTSELQSRRDLVCRLLLEKKKKRPSTQRKQLRHGWWMLIESCPALMS